MYWPDTENYNVRTDAEMGIRVVKKEEDGKSLKRKKFLGKLSKDLIY